MSGPIYRVIFLEAVEFFTYNETNSITSNTWDKFHQCSMRSFYVCKLRAQLFCAYILGLYFTGARLLMQKMRVEHWWNWTLGGKKNNLLWQHRTKATKINQIVTNIGYNEYFLPIIKFLEIILDYNDDGNTCQV